MNVYNLFSYLFIDYFLYKQVLFFDSVIKDSLFLAKLVAIILQI